MLSAIQKYRTKISQLSSSEGFVRYFSNTSWLMVEKVGNLVVVFIIGVLVARYLGPEQFGIYSFSKSIALSFVVLCGVGLERFVVKDFVHQTREREVIFGTVFVLQLCTAMLSVLIFLVISPIILHEAATFYLSLIFIAVTAIDAFSVIRYYFQSQVQARATAKVAMAKIVVSSLIKITLIFYGAPLLYFGFAALAEAIVGSIGLVMVLKRRSNITVRVWKTDKAYAFQLLQNAWPMLISGFLTFIYMEVDQILIKYMLGNREVGLFSVSVKLSNIWFFIGSVLCSSLFPAILNAKKSNEHVYQERMSKLFRLLVTIALVISVTVFLLSDFIIGTLFGADFLAAKGTLQIQIWSVVFVFMGIASTQWFIAEGLQKLLLQRTITGTIVNLALNLLLIPRLGIVGAAIATLVAQFMASYVSNLFSAKTRKLFKIQTQALFFLRSKA